MERKRRNEISKKIASVLLVGLMVVGTQKNNIVCAATTEYLETTYQIDFTNLDVQVTSENKLSIEAKSGLTKNRSRATNSSSSTLESIFEEFPDVEQILIDSMQEGELKAVSFTEVPLTYVDNHYERVAVSNANARSLAMSEQNGKGKFLMWTSITRSFLETEGGYEYTANTYGSWSKNSFLGNSNYPAAGTDFVLQTSPETFSRVSDEFSAKYDDGTEGTDGEEFWRENGGISYVRYAIEDDPFGNVQNKSFHLSTKSIAPGSNEIRHIGSYYVHTWKQMTLSVSVDVSSDKTVTLSLTPGIADKQWQVYNYVSFQF